MLRGPEVPAENSVSLNVKMNVELKKHANSTPVAHVHYLVGTIHVEGDVLWLWRCLHD
jgi:hypothetical protein